jgi:hypothetical protein
LQTKAATPAARAPSTDLPNPESNTAPTSAKKRRTDPSLTTAAAIGSDPRREIVLGGFEIRKTGCRCSSHPRGFTP